MFGRLAEGEPDAQAEGGHQLQRTVRRGPSGQAQQVGDLEDDRHVGLLAGQPEVNDGSHELLCRSSPAETSVSTDGDDQPPEGWSKCPLVVAKWMPCSRRLPSTGWSASRTAAAPGRPAGLPVRSRGQ